MPKTITAHTTTYGPWREGHDERERLTVTSTTYPCDPDMTTGDLTAVDIAETTLREHLHATSPSTWPTCNPGHTWYAQPDPYEHPYSGQLEETTARLGGFTPAEELDLYTRLAT